METPLLLAFLFLLVGLVLGGVLGAWRQRLRGGGPTGLTRGDVERDYVNRAAYEALQQQYDLCHDNLQEKLTAEREYAARIAALETDERYLRDRLREQAGQMERLQEESRLQFEQLATRMLEEKGRQFGQQQQEQLGHLLAPLRQQLDSFKQDIGQRLAQESDDRSSLKGEIKLLRELNVRISDEAGQLASALKGDNKRQGDWGEWQLELLLERAGLEREIHYRAQESFRDGASGRGKRPDFIINLPEEKHLVIDCKVSLTAYEQYCRAEDEGQRDRALRAHLESLRRHVRDLSSKNYEHLHQINSPDYLLLFIPIEPAYALALRHDPQLLTDALDQNIVLATTPTLLAMVRTVSHIWKQEKQKRNVLEIAYQSGLLYDKFVGFVEDLREIGHRLDQAQRAYAGAFNKLNDSTKYGDTLIGRAERLRELGAKHTKLLPAELVMGGQVERWTSGPVDNGGVRSEE